MWNRRVVGEMMEDAGSAGDEKHMKSIISVFLLVAGGMPRRKRQTLLGAAPQAERMSGAHLRHAF